VLSRDNLHEYQTRAVEWIKDNPSCGLFLDMGLGKTTSTLTAVADLHHSFDVARVLIIAPLRVAHHTWPSEIQKWEHLKHLKHSVIKGSPSERAAKLMKRSPIDIINRENVQWLVDHYKKKWPYDMVIIDESSSFKNPSAKRFRALKRVFRLGVTDRVVLLTGTPVSNGLLDMWAQAFLMDAGERLGKTFTGYKNRFFISDYMGFNWDLRPGAEEQIHEKLSDICISMTADEYLSLPDRVDTECVVYATAGQRKMYRSLERDFLLQLQDGDVAAVSAAVLANKLLQFCNGAMYLDGGEAWEEVHTAKIDALKTIVEEAVGAPVLVAYNFKSDIERLMKAFPNGRVLDKDAKTIDDWNAGDIDILFAHPASAGHGLNLQAGGNIAVWFGMTWSLELYQQFNARLHRQGQGKPVFVHHIVMEDSIDRSVLSALASKSVTQASLLSAMEKDALGRQ